MQLILDNIRPTYLEDEKIKDSEVWGKKLEIIQGEKIQVIASSGRGKTSLVHFLYGLRDDYAGRISLNNKDLRELTIDDISSIRSREMSIIFQDLRLFPEHTTEQNIAVKRDLLPFHSPETYSTMAERLGIKSKLTQLSKNCSYGEQQRTAIIRALQQPFQLLLMDEPFSNLDEANRMKAMSLITEEVEARQATVLLFDLKQIEYFKPDRIFYL